MGPATEAAKTEEVDSRELAMAFASAMVEKKAEDVVVLEVRNLIHITHYFVICSGRNRRMVQAIADELELRGKKLGNRPMGVEGFRGGEWVLMDYVDVICHVFLREQREKYDLELHWGDAPRVPLPEGLVAAASGDEEPSADRDDADDADHADDADDRSS